jgi:hypothetical protein
VVAPLADDGEVGLLNVLCGQILELEAGGQVVVRHQQPEPGRGDEGAAAALELQRQLARFGEADVGLQVFQFETPARHRANTSDQLHPEATDGHKRLHPVRTPSKRLDR